MNCKLAAASFALEFSHHKYRVRVNRYSLTHQCTNYSRGLG